MKRILFYLFLLVSIFEIKAQDSKVSGVVVDSLTNQPLEYVNIYLLDTPRGTTSNESGVFQFEGLNTSKVLRFGYVGFKTKDIDFSKEKIDTIRLVRANEQLSEVIVESPKLQKKVKVNGSKGRNNVGVSYMNNGENSGILVRYFEKPTELAEETAYLNAAEFTLFKDLNVEKKDFVFRIRVMSVAEDGLPGYDLLDNRLLKGKPGSKVKIDLSDEHLVISDKGIFVGIEGLQIPENHISTIEVPDVGGSSKMMKTYGPNFKAVKTDQPVYYYSGGDWRKMSRSPVPAINLVITN